MTRIREEEEVPLSFPHGDCQYIAEPSCSVYNELSSRIVHIYAVQCFIRESEVLW